MDDIGDDTPDGRADHDEPTRHRHAAPRPPVSRRRFLGWTAAGGAAAAAAVFGVAEADGSGSVRSTTARHAPPTTTPPVTRTTTPAGSFDDLELPLPVSPAIAAENAKSGDAWWVTTRQAAGDIEGYADVVSARVGDPVTLQVSTRAATFHVEAYRMGYYQGVGGRLVWRSDEMAGMRQAPPVVAAPTRTVECAWEPSLQFTVPRSWPPGAYLLKLVGATGEQGFVPLCVRDDTSQSALLFQHGVTTWQAYNLWGGFSLYYGNPSGAITFTQDPGGGTYAARARTVSFDRPYNHDWASGAADFVGNELPVIFHAEQLGLDVSYWTDVDLHQQPDLLANHRALLSLGHDEYWSAPMRTGVEQAVRAGLNVAFLGANACYRQIRFEPSPLGVDRHVVCYKSAAEDPLTGVDDSLVTVNWELPPVSDPESSMTGGMYQDVGADADLVVADPGIVAAVRHRAHRRAAAAQCPPGGVRPLRARRRGTGQRRRGDALPRGQPRRQPLGHDVVHGGGRRRRARHRQRVLGGAGGRRATRAGQRAAGRGARRHPVPAAHHGERLLRAGHRSGQHHPPLDGQLARRLRIGGGGRTVRPGPEHPVARTGPAGTARGGGPPPGPDRPVRHGVAVSGPGQSPRVIGSSSSSRSSAGGSPAAATAFSSSRAARCSRIRSSISAMSWGFSIRKFFTFSGPDRAAHPRR